MTTSQDVETAYNHLVEQVRLAKADVIHRLESGDRDWDGLWGSVQRYIDFQIGADVLSGQTPPPKLDRSKTP